MPAVLVTGPTAKQNLPFRPLWGTKTLTNDYESDTEDLNAGADQCCQQLGTLWWPKYITMDQLPACLFQCVVLLNKHCQLLQLHNQCYLSDHIIPLIVKQGLLHYVFWWYCIDILNKTVHCSFIAYFVFSLLLRFLQFPRCFTAIVLMWVCHILIKITYLLTYQDPQFHRCSFSYAALIKHFVWLWTRL